MLYNKEIEGLGNRAFECKRFSGSVFISAVLLGRAFCGWLCWFGGYLELAEWVIGKLKIKIPRRMLLYLVMMPFISLALKIYNTVIVKMAQRIPRHIHISTC